MRARSHLAPSRVPPTVEQTCLDTHKHGEPHAQRAHATPMPARPSHPTSTDRTIALSVSPSPSSALMLHTHLLRSCMKPRETMSMPVCKRKPLPMDTSSRLRRHSERPPHNPRMTSAIRRNVVDSHPQADGDRADAARVFEVVSRSCAKMATGNRTRSCVCVCACLFTPGDVRSRDAAPHGKGNASRAMAATMAVQPHPARGPPFHLGCVRRVAR